MFSPNKPRAAGSAHEVIARAIEQSGGAKRVAAILNVSDKAVYAWSDPTVGARMSFEQARALTAACRCDAFAEDFAAQAALALLPVEISSDSLAALGARTARKHGEFIAELLAATADGALDAQETARLRRRALDLIAGLGAAVAKLGEG